MSYRSCLIVKQLLVHEVEKQKILQGSLSKSTNLHVEENHAISKNNSGTRLPFKFSYANGSAEKRTNQKSAAAKKPELSKATDNISSKDEKASGGLTSFFNRLKRSMTTVLKLQTMLRALRQSLQQAKEIHTHFCLTITRGLQMQ